MQGGGAALEGGDALFGDRLGGVHDSGVNVAKFGEGKKVLGVFSRVEHVGGGAINRCHPGVGRRVRASRRRGFGGFQTSKTQTWFLLCGSFSLIGHRHVG
jgi:hypothetical protein